MTLQWPGMLIFLLLVPLFAWIYWRQQRRRQRLLESYSSLGLVQSARGRAVGRRRHFPIILFLSGLAILLFSLARPQATLSLPRIEGNVLLAFDVSGSMAADDFQPTRMEAAKAAAHAFVEKQPATVKVGVVAFSDNGFSVQAPTGDQEAILAAIDRLKPQRSTALAYGILASLNTLASGAGVEPVTENVQPDGSLKVPDIPPEVGSSSVIILLSDGENTTNPDPLEIAQKASELNVRIFTIGIGSPAGTDLQVEGYTVHTSLNEEMLLQIAKISGGAYYNAANAEDLQNVYDSIVPQLVVKPEKIEITAVLAGLGMIVLLVGGLFSLLWFGRLP